MLLKLKNNYFDHQLWLALVLLVLFAVGLWGHLHNPVSGFFTSLSEPFLFLVSLLVIFAAVLGEKNQSLKPFWLWLATGVLITFAVEVVGVKTGRVFGVYEYGQAFDWKLLDVPLVIGLNWVMISLGAILLWQNRVSSTILPLLVGLTAVLFDWFLEPVAIGLDYWQWQGGVVPVQNYVAWFWIAFWLCIFYQSLGMKLKSYLPVVFLLIQGLWFAILKFSLTYQPRLEYWLVICLVLVFTIALSFHPKSDIRPHLKPTLLAIFISSIPFLVWDVWATARGHWQFNPKFIEGFYILNLPLEEVWFFVAVPYSCLYLWSVVRNFETWTKLKQKLISK